MYDTEDFSSIYIRFFMQTKHKFLMYLKKDLQLALNAMHTYCALWKLNVNVTQTKVVLFLEAS
ncbi:hypothetical protein MAR_028250 [Mya arenaria]|uniref:Uncharacterized protein n=1 Tax=Mya arenaria TaxID=6604 RepID=A0ABY7DGV1_MYAAR|nr:hypothetical protein MAR_028250 [Mya arenaria]